MATAEPSPGSGPVYRPVTSTGTDVEAAGLLGSERQALALQRKAIEVGA